MRSGEVAVARQGGARDTEVLGGPSECESGSVKLRLRHGLLIEVSLAENEEMAGGVVVRRGVTGNLGAPQFVEVAIAVDADVVGDVNPPVLVLVVPLVFAQVLGGISVVAEDHSLVVQGHPGDGVTLAAGAGRSRAPGVSAYQLCRGGSGEPGTGRSGITYAGADH